MYMCMCLLRRPRCCVWFVCLLSLSTNDRTLDQGMTRNERKQQETGEQGTESHRIASYTIESNRIESKRSEANGELPHQYHQHAIQINYQCDACSRQEEGQTE